MPEKRQINRAIATADMQTDLQRFPKGSIVTREQMGSGNFDILLTRGRLVPEEDWKPAPASAVRPVKK